MRTEHATPTNHQCYGADLLALDLDLDLRRGLRRLQAADERGRHRKALDRRKASKPDEAAVAAKHSSFRNDRVHLCPAVKTVR